jgi:hypothetical protein
VRNERSRDDDQMDSDHRDQITINQQGNRMLNMSFSAPC